MFGTRFTWRISGVRVFASSAARASRFTRAELRQRLFRERAPTDAPSSSSSSSTGIKWRLADTTRLPDSVPPRPIGDLKRAALFTFGITAVSYTTAILADYFGDGHERFFAFIYQGHTYFKHHEMVVYVIGLCGAVFAAWKVKAWHARMYELFTNSIASRRLCTPMLLSVFSHASFIHLALNMYVLTTFASEVVGHYMDGWEFAAFFLSSGVFASFFGLTHKALTANPVRSLGASGAIMALLMYTCAQMPNARLSIVLLPDLNFSAENAIIGLITFDLLGLLLRWRLFDHAAHLGGSLFGLAYARFGRDLLWDDFGNWLVDLLSEEKPKEHKPTKAKWD